MLEDDEFPHGHFTARSAVIVLEHVQDGLPQQPKVIFREAGGLTGEIGGNITFCTVEGIGDDVLAAHFGALFLSIGLRGDGNAGDRDFLWDDGIHRTRKAQLDRAADLTAVERAFDKRGHNSTKGADIVVVLTHVIAQTAVNVRVTLLGGLEVLADAKSFDGVGIAAVQRTVSLM